MKLDFHFNDSVKALLALALMSFVSAKNCLHLKEVLRRILKPFQDLP